MSYVASRDDRTLLPGVFGLALCLGLVRARGQLHVCVQQGRIYILEPRRNAGLLNHKIGHTTLLRESEADPPLLHVRAEGQPGVGRKDAVGRSRSSRARGLAPLCLAVPGGAPRPPDRASVCTVGVGAAAPAAARHRAGVRFSRLVPAARTYLNSSRQQGRICRKHIRRIAVIVGGPNVDMTCCRHTSLDAFLQPVRGSSGHFFGIL